MSTWPWAPSASNRATGSWMGSRVIPDFISRICRYSAGSKMISRFTNEVGGRILQLRKFGSSKLRSRSHISAISRSYHSCVISFRLAWLALWGVRRGTGLDDTPGQSNVLMPTGERRWGPGHHLEATSRLRSSTVCRHMGTLAVQSLISPLLMNRWYRPRPCAT